MQLEGARHFGVRIFAKNFDLFLLAEHEQVAGERSRIFNNEGGGDNIRSDSR